MKGHSDGLKVDPSTHHLWALQNEDANANLVIINPETHQQKLYTFGPTLHGGASALDIPTDGTVKLNLTDPDSMTLDPQGNIVLDSQGDQELVIVSDPGSPAQRVLHHHPHRDRLEGSRWHGVRRYDET